MISEILIAILLLAGSVFILIAAIGILRLPDVLCRAHALTKAMTLGIALLLLGLLFALGGEVGLKILIAIAFQFPACLRFLHCSSRLRRPAPLPVPPD